jgi:ATP-dependent DNA helicase RecQ
MDEVKFLSRENLDWTKTIKGDVSHDDYPAEQFYNDLGSILNTVGFIRDLAIAECPVSEILPEVKQAFHKQQVDFYIPLLKTVIEVDGSGHKNQIVLDKKRDKAFERAGIKVVRINTKEIRNRNYEQFKAEFREIYKTHKDKVNLYRNYLAINPKDYDVQIKGRAIAHQ